MKYYTGKELMADAKKRSNALNKSVKKENRAMKGSFKHGFSVK